MKLDVILRTHDRSNFALHPSRFIDVPKQDVTRTCAASLVASLRSSGVEHRLTILDDRSSEETLEQLRGYGTIVPADRGRGLISGNLHALRLARESDADLVYLVEDDYLHVESAVQELVEFHGIALKALGPDKEVVLRPSDDTDDYNPTWISPARVMRSEHRHWRSNDNSSGTILFTPRFMRHPEVYRQFERLTMLYMTKTGMFFNIHEGTTINKLYGYAAGLFSPLPGLAAHLNMYEPSLFDWRALWDRFANARRAPQEATT